MNTKLMTTGALLAGGITLVPLAASTASAAGPETSSRTLAEVVVHAAAYYDLTNLTNLTIDRTPEIVTIDGVDVEFFDAMLSPSVFARPEIQGGWDRDHVWVKITRAEIVGGLAKTVCNRVVPLPYRIVACPILAEVAKRLIGSRNGVWAEFYPRTGQVRAGTW